jgi:hypothetical protein
MDTDKLLNGIKASLKDLAFQHNVTITPPAAELTRLFVFLVLVILIFFAAKRYV